LSTERIHYFTPTVIEYIFSWLIINECVCHRRNSFDRASLLTRLLESLNRLITADGTRVSSLYVRNDVGATTGGAAANEGHDGDLRRNEPVSPGPSVYDTYNY
jgi:hypothetical protein